MLKVNIEYIKVNIECICSEEILRFLCSSYLQSILDMCVRRLLLDPQGSM